MHMCVVLTDSVLMVSMSTYITSSALSQLPLYDDDGDRVIGNTDNTTLLYLPWINFTCLLEHDVTTVTTMTVTLNKAPENITSFTEKQFEAFYENETLRHLVFDVEHLRDSPRMKDLGSCFLGETTCRCGFMCIIVCCRTQYMLS